MNRRTFIGTSSSALMAASYQKILGANDRLRMALVGSGRRGRGVMQAFLQTNRSELVAICDVYDVQRKRAREALLKPGEKIYETVALEDVLDRSDIDAVLIASPDHLHYTQATRVLESGRHVYLEKPSTHRLGEGLPLIEAVKKSGKVCQTGTQQRSASHYQRAKEEVFQKGKLGELVFARAVWSNFGWQRRHIKPIPKPQGLDWERFLGPAPRIPFDMARYDAWRYYPDYGGGILADLLTHWADVAQWMMDEPNPLNAVTTGGIYFLKDGRENPDTVNTIIQYPSGWNLTFECTVMPVKNKRASVLFEGTEGSLEISREEYIYRPHKGEPEIIPVQKDITLAHVTNFLDAIKYGKTPSASIEIGVQACRPNHLSVAAYWSRDRMAFNADHTDIMVDL